MTEQPSPNPCKQGHDHSQHDHGLLDRGITRGFVIAIGLTAVTLIAEVIGGFWTNSLALLSDAAHVFMDLFALVLSLTAIQRRSLTFSPSTGMARMVMSSGEAKIIA